MKNIEQQFKLHEEADNTRFNEISSTLHVIKENHLSHIETDMRWIKRLLLAIISGLGVILVDVINNALTK